MGRLLTHLTSVGIWAFPRAVLPGLTPPAPARTHLHPPAPGNMKKKMLGQKKLQKKFPEHPGPGVKWNKDSADIPNGKTVDSPHICGIWAFPVLFCLALLSRPHPPTPAHTAAPARTYLHPSHL